MNINTCSVDVADEILGWSNCGALSHNVCAIGTQICPGEPWVWYTVCVQEHQQLIMCWVQISTICHCCIHIWFIMKLSTLLPQIPDVAQQPEMSAVLRLRLCAVYEWSDSCETNTHALAAMPLSLFYNCKQGRGINISSSLSFKQMYAHRDKCT